MGEVTDFAAVERSLTDSSRASEELRNCPLTASAEVVKSSNVSVMEQNEHLSQLVHEVTMFKQEIRQELVLIRHEMALALEKLLKLGVARDRNVYAVLHNQFAKVPECPLAPLHSINLDAEYVEQLNLSIPDFPETVRAMQTLTEKKCRRILGALDGPTEDKEPIFVLRERVADVIGVCQVNN